MEAFMNNNDLIKKPSVKKRDHWMSLLEQWKDSKISKREFCQQAGINYARFMYWQNVLRSPREAKNNFAPVKIVSAKPSTVEMPQAIQIKLLAGHVVYIPTTMA